MADVPQVFLEPDDEIRGQKFICLSFLSPEKVLKNKDLYFFSKFLEFYALDYKVKATESFVMGQLRDLQSVLGDVQVDLENCTGSIDTSKTELNAYRVPEPEVKTTVTDVSGASVADVSGASVTDMSGSSVTDVSGSTTVVVVNPLQRPRDVMAEASKALKAMIEKVSKTRGSLAQKTATSLDEHVKANMSDFRESTIIEAYEGYMVVNKQKLEDEFHKENNFRTTVRGLKCRGTYSTHEQAVARAQSLHKKDPHFNVYVAEVGQWLPWDPEPDEVADQQYSNEQLNTLMQSYRENATKRDEFFEEQKRERIAQANAASAAANAAKKATFGEKGKEIEAAQLARDLFDGATDLAVQRKAEAAADTISHD
jgi:hypothetical protein